MRRLPFPHAVRFQYRVQARPSSPPNLRVPTTARRRPDDGEMSGGRAFVSTAVQLRLPSTIVSCLLPTCSCAGAKFPPQMRAPWASSRLRPLSTTIAPASAARASGDGGGGKPGSGKTPPAPRKLKAAAGASDDGSERENAGRILRTLAAHLWPSKEMQPDHAAIKARVALSLGLLVGAKLITIQVPFIFKHLVDGLTAVSPQIAESRVADMAAAAGAATTDPMVAVPVALVLGYGVARSTAAGFQELRNAVFATVAQQAIRRVAVSVFEHLHQLDLSYHLQKNTGALSRIIDRGGRSIQFTLSSMVFNVFPTLLEISLVSGIVATQASWKYSMVCFGTIGAYVAYTLAITQWRTQFRKAMIKLENEAGAKVNDSLVNYETVKYFNNEAHESSRYDESMAGYQRAALKTQTSLR
ncbi:unnamed protein product [Phaeothamnion confervicola]